MIQKEIRSWKKVFENDLNYIVYELKELVTTPTLILLEGPMGAGKTTFAKAFITLEGDESMSPSYSVVNETRNVVHADFYRLKSREEIIHLELALYLEGKKYLFVEWGKQHFTSLLKELPENFHLYLMELSINESSQNDIQTRNFTLFEVSES